MLSYVISQMIIYVKFVDYSIQIHDYYQNHKCDDYFRNEMNENIILFVVLYFSTYNFHIGPKIHFKMSLVLFILSAVTRARIT